MRFIIKKGSSLGCATLACCFIVPGALSAAEWRANSGISAGLTYTDNVNLSSSDQVSEVISTVTPSVSLSGRGARANLDFSASVEFNNQKESADSYNTQLQANADIELVERVFFIDARATISQNAIDPTQESGNDNLNNTGNKTTTRTLQISPYFTGRLKRFANYEVRYTHDEVVNTDVENGDSSSELVLFALNSGRDFGKVSWGVRGEHKSTESGESRSDSNSSLDVTLGYQLNRKWQTNATIGREWNDIDTTRQNTDGFTWDMGARWTPSPRTELDFGIGERFFGSTKRLTLNHRNKRTVWSASYSQDLTDSHTLFSNQDVVEFTDPFGNPIDPVTGEIIPVNQNLAQINSGSFVDQRFTTSLTLQGRLTTVSVNGSYSIQTYEDSSRENKFLTLGVSINRRLSGLLSANANLNWNETESTDVLSSKSDTLRFGAGLTQQLGVGTNLLFNYTYAERNTDQIDQGYDENRLALTLTHGF